MRTPLTTTELSALKDLVKEREENERLRRIIAHALKAYDTGDLFKCREILWGAL